MDLSLANTLWALPPRGASPYLVILESALVFGTEGPGEREGEESLQQLQQRLEPQEEQISHFFSFFLFP